MKNLRPGSIGFYRMRSLEFLMQYNICIANLYTIYCV